MKNIIKSLIGIIFLLSGLITFAQDIPSIQVEFNLNGENLDSVYEIEDFKLTIGLDENGDNGPTLDGFDIPGVPPSVFIPCSAFVSFVGNETPLIKDVKHLNDDSLVWQLQIEFGDPSREDCAATGGDIILDWGQDGGATNPFSAAEFNDYTVQLVDFGSIIAGGAPVDLKATTSHTFTFNSPHEIRDQVYISMTKQVNSPPVARDDRANTLVGQPVTISVLENDFDIDDPEKVNLSIVPNDAFQIEGGNIIFTPAGAAGAETFTYAISDGISEATATVTVDVVDNVVFTRNHPRTASPTEEGLVVTIIVNYSAGINPQEDTITLTETLPRFDDALGFWKIPFSAENLPDISGEGIPNSLEDGAGQPLTAEPSTSAVTFRWTPPLPESGFTFNYRITGDEGDVTEKTISGVINGGPEVVTNFNIESCTFHDADSDPNEGGNWKIDISEILRIIQLFNRNKFYKPEVGTQDGFAPAEEAPNLTSGFHDADSDPNEGRNWKIDISEILRIIQLFNKNKFYDCAPNTQDGFTPSEISPVQ